MHFMMSLNSLHIQSDDEDKNINIDGEYGAVPHLEDTEIYCRLIYDDLNRSNLGHWLFVAVCSSSHGGCGERNGCGTMSST